MISLPKYLVEAFNIILKHDGEPGMNRKCMACSFFTLLIIFCLVSFQLSADTKTVRIGFYEYPYFQEIEDDGSYSGYSFDYLQAISQYTGWEYEYVTEYTSSQCLELLKEGKIDMMGVVQKTPEREAVYLFPDKPSSHSMSYIVSDAENMTLAYEDFEAFDGITIGIQKSFARNKGLPVYAEKHGFEIKTITYDTKEAMNQALKSGEVDALLISSNQNSPLYRVLAQFDSDDVYYIINKNRPDILEAMNLAISQLDAAAPFFIQTLYSKHYDFSEGQTAVLSNAEREFVKSNPELEVLIDYSWYPFESYSENKASGISVTLMERIAKSLGISIRFIPFHSKVQKEQYLKNNANVIVPAIVFDYNWASKNHVFITQPYLTADLVAVFTRDHQKQNNSLSAVAVPRGNYISSLIIQYDVLFSKVIYYNDSAECIKAVMEGKADYAVLNSYEFQHLMTIPKYSRLRYRSLQATPLKFSIGVSRSSDPALFSIMEKELKSISQSEIMQIIQSHEITKQSVSIVDFIYNNPLQSALTIIGICLVLTFCLFIFFLYSSNKKKNDLLKKTNEAQSQFISRVSHDMRTPMNGILGIAYLAKDKNDPVELKKDFEQIEQSGQLLLRLINDTLDINKIESGHMELKPIDCDERELFEQIITVIKPMVNKKHIKFESQFQNILWTSLYVDPLRLQQIFLNILSNAVKFTPDNGTISFTMRCLEEDQSMVLDEFIIKDSGIGMSPDFLRLVFEPFSQENRIETSSSDGTGLGLAIVKKIVDLLGGTIEILSKPNIGTQVTVILKLMRSKQAIKQAMNQTSDLTILNGRKVLLCEDNALNATIASKLLQKKGMTVDIAVNGKEGVKKFTKSNPFFYDYILMDILMPVMDGYTATDAIRAMEREDARDIPIISLSANAFASDEENSSAHGINAHLSKPINPELLYSTLVKNSRSKVVYKI